MNNKKVLAILFLLCFPASEVQGFKHSHYSEKNFEDILYGAYDTAQKINDGSKLDKEDFKEIMDFLQWIYEQVTDHWNQQFSLILLHLRLN